MRITQSGGQWGGGFAMNLDRLDSQELFELIVEAFEILKSRGLDK